MQTKRIMVIEPDVERFRQVDFLLRLAGYASRSAGNASEALNWAILCDRPADETLCLLVNSVDSSEEGLDILQPLERYAFPLPVVLVRRGGWNDEALPTRFPTLRLHCCEPTTINQTLAEVASARPPARNEETVMANNLTLAVLR